MKSDFQKLKWLGISMTLLVVAAGSVHAVGGSFAELVNQVQPKMVKLYGAGGLKGLEAYQSGIVIS
ncbi:MAG: serine protease, partial [Planctomycetota bacterium]|nr:serine protease [Planctomycetota bacterium]